MHYISAILFFLCIGYTCIFCSSKSLQFMPFIPHRERIIATYKLIYRVQATLMILLPLLAWILTRHSAHATFWLEAVGIAAFGSYWLVKTSELKKSGLERRILVENLDMEKTPKL